MENSSMGGNLATAMTVLRISSSKRARDSFTQNFRWFLVNYAFVVQGKENWLAFQIPRVPFPSQVYHDIPSRAFAPCATL